MTLHGNKKNFSNDRLHLSILFATCFTNNKSKQCHVMASLT